MCSRWEEPFGRTSLEASSNGCAVIISNRGGLPETVTNGVILETLSVENLYKNISSLIKNTKRRKNLQQLSNQNFYLTHEYVSNIIDNYRDSKLQSFKVFTKKRRRNSE